MAKSSDKELAKVISDLQQIDLEEVQAKEHLEAKHETEKTNLELRYRQRKAVRVYEYSKVEPHYASKLASGWGRDRQFVQRLKKEGEQISLHGVSHGVKHQIAGVKAGVAKMGQMLESASGLPVEYQGDDVYAIDFPSDVKERLKEAYDSDTGNQGLVKMQREIIAQSIDDIKEVIKKSVDNKTYQQICNLLSQVETLLL